MSKKKKAVEYRYVIPGGTYHGDRVVYAESPQAALLDRWITDLEVGSMDEQADDEYVFKNDDGTFSVTIYTMTPVKFKVKVENDDPDTAVIVEE
jgi:hypothetical protein